MSRLPHRLRRPGRLGAGLILLALWVQVWAPVAALPMALAADPLTGAVICGHAAGGDDAPVARQAPPPQPCDLCRLCRAGIAPPPLPAPAPVLARSLRWVAVAWPVPPPARLSPIPRRSGRPRDPPAPA